jgi:hypothetical protein
MADGFHPIWLQNYILKLVTRILMTRLQSIIEMLVAFEQCSFIKGRTLADNFLYAVNLV